MRNKNKQIGLAILLLSAVLFAVPLKAQVTIGDQSTPDPDAVLDLRSNLKLGLLLPRLPLQATTSFSPMSAHVAGMVVYNTATAGDVTPGFYYNDGAKWVRIGSGSGGGSYPTLTSTTGLVITGSGTAAQTVDLPSTGATNGQVLTWNGAAWAPTTLPAASSGTVTNFIAHDLTPLFTTTVATPSTAPELSFTLSTAPANNIFGNNTANPAAPNYFPATALAIAGDVTGTLGASKVSSIQGQTLPTTAPTNGQTLVSDGAGALTWQTPAASSSNKLKVNIQNTAAYTPTINDQVIITTAPGTTITLPQLTASDQGIVLYIFDRSTDASTGNTITDWTGTGAGIHGNAVNNIYRGLIVVWDGAFWDVLSQQ